MPFDLLHLKQQRQNVLIISAGLRPQYKEGRKIMSNEEMKLVVELLSKISEDDKEKFITYLTALRDSEDSESPLLSCCRSKTSEVQ